MLQRLKDQLSVQKKVEAIHANPRLLKELALYPGHDKRLETARGPRTPLFRVSAQPRTVPAHNKPASLGVADTL